VLHGAFEGEPGFRGKAENIRPVPCLRLVVVIVPFNDLAHGYRPDRDYEEVLVPIKEECMVVGERC